MAKPHSYTQEVGDEILRRFANGETIKAICLDAHMPSRSCVYLWLADEREELVDFRKRLKAAEVAHAYALVDDAMEIADDSSRDIKIVTRADGSEYEVTDHEVLGRSKLRVDIRMKLAEKRAPKVFGESLAVTGADGGPIMIDDKSKRDVGRRVAFAMAAGLIASRKAEQQEIDAEYEEVSDGGAG